jgi:glycosyltransferase involved in cell wall biosynthesis
MGAAAPLNVAYLVNQYPKVSHAFIRREIAAVERSGVPVERFSIRSAGETFPDEADRLELSKTRVVLKHPLVLLWSLAAAALLRPLKFAKALWLALRIGWGSDRGLLRNLAYLAEACVLLRWLRQSGAAHVHAHFGTNPAAVAMLCSVLGGPPYSFTCHGPDEFDRAPSLALDEKIARAAFVVTVSSYGRGQLYRWCHRRHWPKIHVLHPGLDEAWFHQRPIAPPEAPRFACIGRLHEQKGQMLLIQAVAQLVSEGVPCELVLVGDGPMRSELAASVAQMDLEKHVTFAGLVSSEEAVRRMQDARAVIMPSFAENLPSVILEAFALQRPVIATFVGGIPELVEPGVCGWLVAPASAIALADAMRDALRANVSTLESMGKDGARRVAENYRADAAGRRLAQMFDATGGP